MCRWAAECSRMNKKWSSRGWLRVLVNLIYHGYIFSRSRRKWYDMTWRNAPVNCVDFRRESALLVPVTTMFPVTFWGIVLCRGRSKQQTGRWAIWSNTGALNHFGCQVARVVALAKLDFTWFHPFGLKCLCSACCRRIFCSHLGRFFKFFTWWAKRLVAYLGWVSVSAWILGKASHHLLYIHVYTDYWKWLEVPSLVVLFSLACPLAEEQAAWQIHSQSC